MATAEWRVLELGELARLRKGVSYQGAYLDQPGPRLLGLGTVVPGGGVHLDAARTYAGPIRPWQYIEPGEVLVALTDITQDGRVLGSPGLLPSSGGDTYAVTHHVARVEINKPELLEAKYLYYLLQGPDARHYMRGVATGTTVRAVSIADAERFPMSLPPLQEQRAIAHILGTLDDKIELNRRMNETLEAMARALFKSWFVDFDPVRANAEGLSPGLPTPVADLFPDRFIDSDLGEIPEGWSVVTVGDEFAVTMGQSPPGSSYNQEGEGVPFFQGRADFGARFPRVRVYCTAPTRLAKPGDTLISVRAPVGAINMAETECCIGRGVAAARHKSGSQGFTYQSMLAMTDDFDRFEAYGTVFGAINKGDFLAIPCIRAPRSVISAFESAVVNIELRIAVAFRESRSLRAIRDGLLPRLISGDLRVPQPDPVDGRAV